MAPSLWAAMAAAMVRVIRASCVAGCGLERRFGIPRKSLCRYCRDSLMHSKKLALVAVKKALVAVENGSNGRKS